MAWFVPEAAGADSGPARCSLGRRPARNEQGIDAWGIDRAIARFVELLGETCPDLAVEPGAVDARGGAPSMPAEHRSTTVRVAEVNRILGTDLGAADLAPLLDPIGFTVSGER